MVILRWTTMAALLVSVASCQPVKKGQTTMNGSISLVVTAALGQTQLVVRYEVTNRDQRDIYLLNRLYRTSPQWDMSPNVIYVQLDESTATVWLSKKLADLPAGMRVTSPVAPYVTPVRANSSYREEVQIPTPVREYQQYGGGKPEAEQSAQVRIFHHVRLMLGYYKRPDGTQEEIRDIQGTPVVFPKTPPGVRLEFGELHSEDIRVDVPVIARTRL